MSEFIDTFTDPAWMQVYVSVLASIGLFWTLLLQRRTLEDQKEIMKFEREKDRRTIMPYFRLDSFTQEKELYGRVNTFYIILENNKAYSVKFKRYPGSQTGFFPMSASVFQIGEKCEGVAIFNYDVGYPTVIGYIEFHDSDGRPYTQLINYDPDFVLTAPLNISHNIKVDDRFQIDPRKVFYGKMPE